MQQWNTKFSQQNATDMNQEDYKSQSKDLIDDVSNSMIITIIGHSLELAKANEKLTSQQVFDILNPRQLNTYKDFLQKSLIKQQTRNLKRDEESYKSDALIIDFGSYPLTPWLNKPADKKMKEFYEYQHTHKC